MHRNNLKAQLNDKQRLYRDIFIRAKDALVAKLQTFTGKEARLHFLNNVVSKDILKRLREIQKAREFHNCCRCGTCCKVASSEFNYSELLDKAANGDVFAKSFTSVFVPLDETPKDFDDYVELLKERGMLEQTYFYHCPKCVSGCDGDEGAWEQGIHTCSDYENRPAVCRDFPNNPLVLLPPKCSFSAWKDEFEIEALFLNAMIEIAGYFIEELNKPDGVL